LKLGPRDGGREFWLAIFVRLALAFVLSLGVTGLLLGVMPHGGERDRLYFIGGCLTLVLAGLAVSCLAVASQHRWAVLALPFWWTLVAGLCVGLILNP